MSDVRLTATNPEDSSVVPVACNAKGELLLEEPIAPPEFDGNLDGDLTVSGSATFVSATFSGGVYSGQWGYDANSTRIEAGIVSIVSDNSAKSAFVGYYNGYGSNNVTSQIRVDGSATFKGDVVIASRGKSWMLVESGGLCHMVEQKRATTEYPKLRDVFAELNVIEKALEEVMAKLRMTEPDGWPVWDGSDNSR